MKNANLPRIGARLVRAVAPGLSVTAVALLSACAVVPVAATDAAASAPATLASMDARGPEDEIIYFVLPDRFENANPANDTGGITGTWREHGFRPDHRGFYLGGDLQGLTERLDYIQGLGVTAIWLGPIYQNKPVQGAPGQESSGYHGYWITDFTSVDPHFGTEDDMHAFVDAVHARGMRVYLDIITNHTADVIAYRECHDPNFEGERIAGGECAYRSKGDYPFSTRGRPDGEAINDGFLGDQPPHQTVENFARLTDPDFAYTPFIPAGEEDVKTPAWLNDISLYHNRGNSSWHGESVTYGDFAGLDDLATENPRVVEGFIEIFSDWITRYRIDGFRIDTAKHVNPEFWHEFNPAILAHAESLGIDHFYIFGEAAEYEPHRLAWHMNEGGFEQALDFGMHYALQDVVVNGVGTGRLESLFVADDLFDSGPNAPLRMTTFFGNHDFGRMGGFLREAHPEMSDAEMVDRIRLAHAALFFLRGVPVVYYGDEQGFISDGNDQRAREPMFPSQVAEYNDNDLAGTDATTADENFDPTHPLYRAISGFAALRTANEGLRRGEQVVRLAEQDGGVFVVSRLAPSGGEIVVALNFRNEPRRVNVVIDPRSSDFTTLTGACAPRMSAPGSYAIDLPALGYAVCRSQDWTG